MNLFCGSGSATLLESMMNTFFVRQHSIVFPFLLRIDVLSLSVFLALILLFRFV